MPRTQYTTDAKAILGSIENIPNYPINGLSLYNSRTNEVIVDALRITKEGDVIFKDRFTEVFLRRLIEKGEYISETYNNDQTRTLYFKDNFNRRYSLGEIYFLLFQSVPKNLMFWWGERASDFLDFSMDQHILDNFFTVDIQYNDDDDTAQKYRINNENWVNKWIDIPCLNVTTPEYIDDKFASISAKLNVKFKTNKSLATGFRIFDATAGMELTRVVHHTNRNEFGNAISIPMHYQGPMPDTPLARENEFQKLTYDDLHNIMIIENVEAGKVILDNQEKYELIPITKHIIKIQYIVCELASGANQNGERVDDADRALVPEGESCLDVCVYSKKPQPKQVIQLNGQVDTAELEPQQHEYKYQFPITPYGLTTKYAIKFTTNKNINVDLVERNLNGFICDWGKTVEGLIINWTIFERIDVGEDSDVEDLYRLTDKNRNLNHFLFTDNKTSLEFCDSYYDFGPPPPPPLPPPPPPPPTCYCCECCQESRLKINYTLLNGLSRPVCYDDLIYKTVDSYGTIGYRLDMDFQFLAELDASVSANCEAELVGGGKSKVVGPGETVQARVYYLGDCNPDPDPTPTPNNVVTPVPYQPQDTAAEAEARNYIRRVSSIGISRVSTLQFLYNDDFTYKGIDLSLQSKLLDYLENIAAAKKKGLLYLQNDKKANPKLLPAQLVSDYLINLGIPYDAYYDSFFEVGGTRLLTENDPSNLKSLIIVTDGFLGSTAFKHNFAIFDPRPNVTPGRDERPMFPGYDPIYNKRTKEEILEHIYTTIYPSNNIPVFPNFRIGDVAVNGELYNPLFDIRNYRLNGIFDFENNRNNVETFKCSAMSAVNGYFVQGMYLEWNGKYYRIEQDLHTLGANYVSIYKNTYQKVKPTGTIFKAVSQDIYDANAANQIPV